MLVYLGFTISNYGKCVDLDNEQKKLEFMCETGENVELEGFALLG